MEYVLDLTGKRYIVTDASSGIGRETCKYLAKIGAIVILIARNEVRLKECIAAMEREGHRYYLFAFLEMVRIFSLKKYNTGSGSIFKAGVESLVRTAAKEFLAKNIRINCVRPG